MTTATPHLVQNLLGISDQRAPFVYAIQAIVWHICDTAPLLCSRNAVVRTELHFQVSSSDPACHLAALLHTGAMSVMCANIRRCCSTRQALPCLGVDIMSDNMKLKCSGTLTETVAGQ